ncbi:hypothetical protein KL938_002111 [Ogataea parapolymorpha]|nr:hypothetical protein KL938_002111 [Ogataea parapolymorpha]
MSFDDFMDSQKVVYELKPAARVAVPDRSLVYYQEGVPTESTLPFVRLLNGNEPKENVYRRYELFVNNWAKQHDQILQILQKNEKNMFVDLQRYLSSDENSTVFKDQPINLSTALLNLGPNISNHSLLLQNVWQNLVDESPDAIVVRLSSKVCSTVSFTMKILATDISRGLKTDLGRAASVPVSDSDDDMDSDPEDDEGQTRTIEMDSLMEKVFSKDKRLIVMIEDADSFPTSILTPLIKVLWNYNNQYRSRIRLVIGMSTPFEIFHEKLPKLTVKYMRPKYFQIDNTGQAVNEIMENVLLNINDTYDSLILEPRLVLKFLELKSKISISQFVNSMKVIYMSHYYSQPLSVMWTNDFSKIQLNSHVFDVFKRLPSVRRYEQSLDAKQAANLHKLLVSDNEAALGDLLRQSLNKLIHWRYKMKTLVDLLNFMQEYFLETSIWTDNLDLFRLIFENVSYEEEHSNFENFQFLHLLWKKIRFSSLHDVNSFIKTVREDADFGPLFENDHLRELSATSQTKQFVAALNRALLRCLEELNLNNIPFREICCVDLSALDLLTNTFNPQVRATCIESLLNSKNYLLNTVHSDLSQLDPESFDMKLYRYLEPSVIELYKLSREAGVITNVYDFYQVFKNSLPREELQNTLREKSLQTQLPAEIDDLTWDKMTLSWFLKSLAELQTLGFVREVKNKSETLEKIIWKDL